MRKKLSVLLLALVMLATTLLATSCGKAETVYILKDVTTEYGIVYSKDEVTHYSLASEIFSEMLIEYSGE